VAVVISSAWEASPCCMKYSLRQSVMRIPAN
jgi:hypothetical protein